MGDKAERETVKRRWRVADVVQVVRAAAQSREGEKRGDAHRKFEAGMVHTDAAGASARGNARKLRQQGEKWGSRSQNTFTFFFVVVVIVQWHFKKTRCFFFNREKIKNTVSTDIQQRAQATARYRRESRDEQVKQRHFVE